MDQVLAKTRGERTLILMIRSKQFTVSEVRDYTWNTQLQRLRPLLWIALFLSVSFRSVPAAAQSYAYVPTHKSNPVSVITPRPGP